MSQGFVHLKDLILIFIFQIKILHPTIATFHFEGEIRELNLSPYLDHRFLHVANGVGGGWMHAPCSSPLHAKRKLIGTNSRLICSTLPYLGSSDPNVCQITKLILKFSF
jgi:hypothetical protein